MNRREKTKLKTEQRAEAARKARIAGIKAGKIEAPATYNDPLQARKEACKEVASELPFKSMTSSEYTTKKAEIKKEKEKKAQEDKKK